MIYLPHALLTLMLLTLLIDTKKGILFCLIIRPIIDCFWEAKYSFFDLKPTEIISVAFPSVVFLKMLIGRPRAFLDAPFSLIWIIYIFYQLMSAAIILTMGEGILESLNFYFRAFNGFIGFYLFQEHFNDLKGFKRLLLALLITGLFPMAQSFYQNILGGSLKVDKTVGNIIRYVGLYHDGFTLRYYGFQTLTAVILFFEYFVNRGRRIARFILFSYGLFASFTIYRILSKAALFTGALWMLIQNVFKFRLWLLTLLILAIVTAAAVKPELITNIGVVFSKEVEAIEGKEKLDRIFQGRWYGWKQSLQAWMDLPITLKLIGDSRPNTGMHNDFLRALMATGIAGLSIYLILLGVITIRVIRNCLRDKSPLNLMSLMLITMWITDCVGLVPGAYPAYQWYIWGFVGLALRGVHGEKEEA